MNVPCSSSGEHSQPANGAKQPADDYSQSMDRHLLPMNEY